MKKPLSQLRILLKISGEALCADQPHHAFALNALNETAQMLAEAHDAGMQIAIVCGGGNIVRGAELMHDAEIHNNDNKHYMHRADADKIGMLATVMNSLALSSSIRALGKKAAIYSALPIAGSVEAFNRHEAIHALERHEIVLLAGGIGRPYFTTDSTAVLRGLELECDYIVKATKVDGVYDSDPIKNPNAKRYSHLTYQTAIEKNLRVMDQTAFTLAQENDLDIIVTSLTPHQPLKEILQGKGNFTRISNQEEA